jgi:asparagine synthase (glutamine-hydrolysing)
MCGIAGIIRWMDHTQPVGSRGVPRDCAVTGSWLDVLDSAVAFRGPDARGRFHDSTTSSTGEQIDVAFAHRRLSIIDHAGGGQPMCWEPQRGVFASQHGDSNLPDGKELFAVSFNGCVYNHERLRERLVREGYEFNTRSDTESLIHAYRAWGHAFTGRLEGMYVFSIWDRGAATLTLARDYYGEKPLFYTLMPQHRAVAWASTAGALYRLRSHLGLPTPNDPQRLAGWISMGRGYHDTPWRDISMVRPGEQLVFDTSPMAFRSLHADDQAAEDAVGGEPGSMPSLLTHATDEQLIDAIDALIDSAVGARMQADVAVSCFLSGGIDSSLIAAAAAKRRAGIKTICVTMPDIAHDESAHARAASEIIGSTHVTQVCQTDTAAGDLTRLIEQIGLPFGDSSLLPTHWAAQAAAGHGGVVLTGDGGDELFWGYQRTLAAPWVHRLGTFAGLFSPLAVALCQTRPRSRLNKLGRLIGAAAGDGYVDLLRIFPSEIAHPLMPGISLPATGGPVRTLADAQRVELREHLPNDMLFKVDSATMGVPIEARAPFLSGTIRRGLAPLDHKKLMLGGKRKGLLRALALRKFPRAIIERPKQGFAIPIGQWFREDRGGLRTLLMDTLDSRDAFSENVLGLLVDRRYVRCLVDQHMQSQRDHSQRLHMLLVLALWTRWCETASRGA